MANAGEIGANRNCLVVKVTVNSIDRFGWKRRQ